MIRLGQNVKMAQLLNIKEQVLSIWATGCMLDDCVCIFWLGHDYRYSMEGESHGILLFDS